MARSSVVGSDKVKAKLRKKVADANAVGKPFALVGYDSSSASYGVYVHEDMQASHAPGKTAKFLTKPFRQNLVKYRQIIRSVTKRMKDNPAKGLVLGIKLAGLSLQRDSMAIVPIDTGNLQGSAFTRVGKE